MIIQETTKMSEREKMAARNSNFCFLLNALYPVGSIYVSKDPTEPAELFGGSWRRIKERFIWAIGDNENPGDTGGEKTHTLTEAELPKLSGSILNFALQEQGQSVSTSGVFSTRASQEWATYGSNGKIQDSDIVDFSAGSGQAHNNMPPWEGFYIWERIESDVPMGGSAGMLLADQIYNPESANAQSGIAVAQAIDTCSPAIVITSDTGKAISIPDSSESVLKGLTAYGESTQDGTPAPDSPVEIESIENPVISVYGKNLISYPFHDGTTTISGVTFTDNNDGIVIANGTANDDVTYVIASYIPLKGTYTLSGTTNGSVSTYFMALGSSDYADIGNGITRTYTVEENQNIFVRIKNGTTVNNLTFKPQLELGSVATSYEPYTELQSVTVPYTFRGIKNPYTSEWVARDELRVGDGKVEIVRNVGYLECTSDLNWVKSSVTTTDLYSYANSELFGNATNSTVFPKCTNFVAEWANVVGDFYIASGRGYFNYATYNTTTLEDWKSFLDTANMSIIWASNKGTVEDITATEAGQELLALKSNYPSTSVISDIDLNLTYRADTKNYIDNKIAERLSAIETAILNNI